MQVERRLRTEVFGWKTVILSGGRVSNAWATCPIQGDSSWKRLVRPHKSVKSHDLIGKWAIRYRMGPRPISQLAG